MKAVTTLLIGALAAKQVVATWDLFAPQFNCPSNTDNQCDDDDKNGFNWDDLNDGDDVGDYKGYQFGGFKCSNKLGKRDELSKRTFQNKCITGTVTKDKKNGPTIFSSKKNFSIDEMQISADIDIDVEFHYGMPDGSTCRQPVSCKKGGSIVKNTQCGGAKEVTFKIPGKGKKEKCEIGFHSIGFNCDKPTPKPTPTSTPAGCEPGAYGPGCPMPTPTPTPTPTPSQPAEGPSSSAECQPGAYGPGCPESASVPAPSSPVETASLPPPTEVPSSTGDVPEVPTSTPVAPTSSTPEVPEASSSTPEAPPSSTPEVPVVPSSTPGAQPSTIIPSDTPCESGSYGCPGAPSSTPTPETPSTTPVAELPSSAPTPEIPSQTADVPCTPGEDGCPAPASSTVLPVQSSASTPGSPIPTSQCPPELPRCINTFATKCKSNTDHACFCADKDLVKEIIDCVDAWTDNEDTIKDALNFFVGICAPFVPENPAIVTDCPSTITLGPTPPPVATPPATPSEVSPPPAGSTDGLVTPPPAVPTSVVNPVPGVPQTTLTVTQVVTVPCDCEDSESSVTSTTTSTITIPQVHFTTVTEPAPGQTPGGVELAPGAPQPVLGNPTSPGGSGVGPTTGFVSSVLATPTPTGTPIPFTGAAVKFGASSVGVIAGALLAIVAW